MPDPPPRHAGRIVDPSVADEDDDASVPIEQMSEEPPEAAPETASQAPELLEYPDAPPLRPRTLPPLPSSEVLLDPREAPPPIPAPPRRQGSTSVLSPTMTAVFGALFGLAGLFAIFALLHRFAPHPTPGTVAATAAASTSARPEASAARPATSAVQRSLPNLDEEDGPALPGPWRVSTLASDDSVRIASGTVGLEAFVNVMQDKAKISKKETYRILTAFKGFDVFKRLRKADRYTVAVDKASGRIKAFELEVSPFEVYQAKEDESGLLTATRLDMKVGDRQRSTGVRITGGPLADDLRAAHLRESVVTVIDAAFDGRASVASMPKNSTLRVIVREKTALGRFASYDYIEALEYVSSKPDSKPLRLYRFQDGGRFGYFDQQGREPYRGGWRRPCPGAPVTSPFNPKRMHPVLHVIKPHEGTDFGAAMGTPIHATSYGTVQWVGPRGPAGNLVIIEHPGKIESYYMHMSRFADGLSKGDKVETFQVIGYVGSTGRSTGPHLHFGIKKNGVWIDPLSLKLDGDRLVSASLRGEFDKVRAAYDAQLDAIPLPEPVAEEAPAATAASAVPEGEESDEPAPAGSTPAPPAEATPPAGAGVGNADDDELEPEGFRDPRDRPDPAPRR